MSAVSAKPLIWVCCKLVSWQWLTQKHMPLWQPVSTLWNQYTHTWQLCLVCINYSLWRAIILLSLRLADLQSVCWQVQSAKLCWYLSLSAFRPCRPHQIDMQTRKARATDTLSTVAANLAFNYTHSRVANLKSHQYQCCRGVPLQK